MQEHGAEVDRLAIDAAGGAAAADAAGTLHHQHLATSLAEPSRTRQAGHAGTNHDHIMHRRTLTTSGRPRQTLLKILNLRGLFDFEGLDQGWGLSTTARTK